MKDALYIFALVVALAIGFGAGKLLGGRHVRTYQGPFFPISFNTASPIYGLPLVEYSSTLRRLREQQGERAAEALEAYLDLAVEDAMRRRDLLKGDDLRRLDKALSRVAEYRSKHPRFAKQTTNAMAESDVYLNAARLAVIDAFLQRFR